MTIHEEDRRGRMITLVANVRNNQRHRAHYIATTQGAELRTMHMWVLLTVLRAVKGV